MGYSLDDIKIVDFGLNEPCAVTVPSIWSGVEPRWYQAPETILDTPQPLSDIWAIGCIFAEAIIKRPLFKGVTEIDQLDRIFHVLGSPTEQSWPGVTKLKNYNMVAQNIEANPIQRVVPGLDKLQPPEI